MGRIAELKYLAWLAAFTFPTLLCLLTHWVRRRFSIGLPDTFNKTPPFRWFPLEFGNFALVLVLVPVAQFGIAINTLHLLFRRNSLNAVFFAELSRIFGRHSPSSVF
jgi:hypothetical protein